MAGPTVLAVGAAAPQACSGGMKLPTTCCEQDTAHGLTLPAAGVTMSSQASGAEAKVFKC